MAVRKNWFDYAALVIFEVCAAFALFSGIQGLAYQKTYPYLWYGGAVCTLALMTTVIVVVSKLPPRLRLTNALPGKARRVILSERLAIIIILAAGAFLRAWVIARFPVAPASDYETYYNIAVLLSKGTLVASGYSGYIAEFPHVIGYPFILSLLFRITGPSLTAGLSLNAAASLFSAYIVYRIARKLGGRLAGFGALTAAALWPSQLLYGAILASEPVFTCALLLTAWLFIYLFQYPARLGNIEGSMFLCVTFGILVALSAAVRPLSEILLIAAVLCLAPHTVKFGLNDKMLYGKWSRLACQGWFRALVIVLSYLVVAGLLSASIGKTIAYRLPGGTVSFGYNLMVGVNIDAKGAWNEKDAEFFSSTFTATNSPEAAHRSSMDVALGRMKENPVGVLNLALEKTAYLWENDDYASYWVTHFLDQQGNLTPERQNAVAMVTPWNNYGYLISVFLSALYGVRLLKKRDAGPAQVFVLLFIGTVALHMILESQNRYHYFMLPVFMILASLYVSDIYHDTAGDIPAARAAPG